MKLFELFATLNLDTTGFENGVQGAKSKIGGLEQAVGNGLEKASKIVTGALTAAGTALVTFTKSSIESAATVMAENAAFESTFGSMAGEAKSAYKIIGDQANILSTRLQATGTKGFAQLKGSGLSANEALEASSRLLTLAADGAAYYDMSLEDVDMRLRSFLRGNVEAGDQIGLFTSELQRNNKAMELYGKKWKDLNESQRQLTMLNIAEEIYKNTGAVGQAAREADGWANTIENVKGAWEQATAAFGKPVIEAITPAINGIVKTLQSEEVRSTLEQFGSIVGEGVADAISQFNTALQWSIENKDKVKTAFEGIASSAAAILAIKHPIVSATAGVTLFITEVSSAIEKARQLAEEEAPKLIALAEKSGAPAESVPGIVEGAQEIIVAGEAISDVASGLGEAATAPTFDPGGKKAAANKNFWEIARKGVSALIYDAAETYVENESAKTIKELTQTAPETHTISRPLTSSDLAAIAKAENLSPYETKLLMNGKYSPTLVSGSKKTLHPDPSELAPFVDQKLLAKDAEAAIREAEKAYRSASQSAYEMGRSISASTTATETGTEKTKEHSTSVSDAERELSEYVMGLFRASETSQDNVEKTETLNKSLEDLKKAVDDAKQAQEEMAQSAEQVAEEEAYMSDVLGNVTSTASGTETQAKSTAEAIKNMFPGVSPQNIVGSLGAVEIAMSGVIAKAAATAAAISAVFSQSFSVNALYGAGYFATGLERVPYDGFGAILHKDEMVLSKNEADSYRAGNSMNGKSGLTVVQNIQAVPQTASELAFQTMNALEMLRFA